MSQKIQVTLPDKTYELLETMAEKEKIKTVTLAAAILRKVLEEGENGK